MQFLSLVYAAVASSGTVKETAPYDVDSIFTGLVPSTARSCSMCEAESLGCCCCFSVSQQTNPWVSVNLTSAVGEDYCH